MRKRIISIMFALALTASGVLSEGVVNIPVTGIISVNKFKTVQAATKDSEVKIPENGDILPDTETGYQYKITKSGVEDGTVAFVSAIRLNEKEIIIPDMIELEGVTYKVTSIEKNALKNYKKLKTVVISANISKIGVSAFKNCKVLKNITIESTKLTKESIGRGSFNGISAGAKIKVPSEKYSEYKKIFKDAGVSAKIVK